MLRLIGNILWFVLGGFSMGLAWAFVGVIAFVSIIGIPWERACFMIKASLIGSPRLAPGS